MGSDETLHEMAPDRGEHGGDEHGGDEHGHAGTALGPVDLQMWGVGLIGVLIGLASAAIFALSTGRL